MLEQSEGCHFKVHMILNTLINKIISRTIDVLNAYLLRDDE